MNLQLRGNALVEHMVHEKNEATIRHRESLFSGLVEHYVAANSRYDHRE